MLSTSEVLVRYVLDLKRADTEKEKVWVHKEKTEVAQLIVDPMTWRCAVVPNGLCPWNSGCHPNRFQLPSAFSPK